MDAGDTPRRVYVGVPIAGGSSVVGTLCLAEAPGPEEPTRDESVVLASHLRRDEVRRAEEELSALEAEIQDTAGLLAEEGFASESDILRTHALLLQDRTLRAQIREKIETLGVGAESAVARVFGELRGRLRESDHEVTRERAADIDDLMQRLTGRLSRRRDHHLRSSVGGVEKPILVVQELLVSEVAVSREAGVVAFVVGAGTDLSHAVIVAKAFGIPVLRLSGIDELRWASRAPAVVDSRAGSLIVNPTEDDCRLMVAQEPIPESLASRESSPLSIWINAIDHEIPGPETVAATDGVGLYRREFILGGAAGGFPTEEEQVGVYRSLSRRWPRYPVTVRTFDIGGDKTGPSFFPLKPRQAPFLGLELTDSTRSTRNFSLHRQRRSFEEAFTVRSCDCSIRWSKPWTV